MFCHVYLTERGFGMDGMLDFYGSELQGVATGRSGYDCIRTAGEMTWALRDIPGVEDLLAYEARVNQVMAANPFYIQPEEFLRQQDN